MFKILKYLKWWQWIIVGVILGLTIFQVWLDLKLPEYMAAIIGLFKVDDSGAIPVATIPSSSELWANGGMMLLVVLGSVALAAIAIYLAAKVSASLAKRVRRELFNNVTSFSMEEMNKFSTPSLITRTTNDIGQVQQVLAMMLRMAFFAPTMAIMAVIKIIGQNATLTWVTVAAVGCLLVLILVMFIFVVPKFSLMQKQTDKLNGVARENLTGLKIVRANGAEDIQEQKFENVNTTLTKTNLFVNKVSSILMPGMMLIMSGLSIAIYWVGAILLNNSVITDYNVVVLFSQYAVQVVISFLVIAMLFVMFPRGQVSAKRVLQVLNTKTNIVEGTWSEDSIVRLNEQTNKYDEVKGELEFKNVSFKYPDAEGYVLKDISFKAEKGQTVAFIGSTGSGKSTLINLIPRFFDATEGEVLIDGINVKEYKKKTLNNKLGYVPQRGILFSGSIRENIKYGNKDATDEDIEHALKIAQASNFVGRLDSGLDYHISQGGKNVSGGQRQRLSIARAVVKNPEIYIFDDSFSALDYKTDKALRAALKKQTKSATNVIVAQRVGSIMDADKIIVLEKGQIVGCGTHKELLTTCKVYQEIAYSQLSKEELA